MLFGQQAWMTQGLAAEASINFEDYILVKERIQPINFGFSENKSSLFQLATSLGFFVTYSFQCINFVNKDFILDC